MKRIFVYAIAAVAVVLLAVCLFRYAGWGRESEKEDEGLNGFYRRRNNWRNDL